MARKTRERRETNETARFRCGTGIGILREEVWVDEHGNIVRYNLAFVLPNVQHADNGRILGYDNAHGYPERHWEGKAEPVAPEPYEKTHKRFLREAAELRRQYGGKGIS